MKKLLIIWLLLFPAVAVAQPGSGIKVDSSLQGNGSTTIPLGISPTYTQRRVVNTCVAGQSIREIAQDGSVTCETDDLGFTVAGAGLTDSGNTINVGQGLGITVAADDVAIDPTYTQRRVVNTCAAGTAIREIAQDGSVTCETDDDTPSVYTAGDGLALTGNDFDLIYTSDFTITSDQLDLSTAVTAPGTLAIAGGAAIGDSASLDTHTAMGRLTHTAAGFADSFTSTLTSSGATFQVNGATFTSTGTLDATAATRNNYAVIANATGTRSAGANSVVNNALYANASGGQANRAIYTDNGDVFLNQTSGNTLIGANTITGTVQGGTRLLVEKSSGDIAITARVAGEDRDVFMGVDDTQDYARIGTTAAQQLAIRTSNSNRAHFDSTGQLNIGDVGISGIAADTTTTVAIGQTSAFTTGQLTHSLVDLSNAMTMPNTVGASGTTWTTYGIKGAFTPALTGSCTGVPEVSVCDSQNAYGLHINVSPAGADANGINVWGGHFTADAPILAGTAIGVYATATGVGTKYALWADGNVTVIGDTVIGGSANVSGDFSMGNADTDSHTILGRMAQTAALVDASNPAYFINGTFTGATYSPIAMSILPNGSLDATAATRTSTALQITNNTTRSAGGNATTNYGVYVNVTNASSVNNNHAIYAAGGLVTVKEFFSASNQNDFPTRTRLADFSYGNTAITFSPGNVLVSQVATVNTTAGALTSTALEISNQAARSAGANNLTNYGLLANSSGGQDNRAIQTNVGDVRLNQQSGSTGIGLATGDTIAAKLHVKAGTSSGLATALTGTAMVIEQANGTAAYLQFRSNTTAGIGWAAAGSGGDGKIIFDSSTNAMQFATSNAFRHSILAAGDAYFGDTTSTAVDNNVDVLTIGNSGGGQTASKALLLATHTGSFDTTAAQRINVGLYSELTSTRSAGANNLTNKAGYFSATGGQINYALETGSGDNRFNVGGGTSSFHGNVTVNSGSLVQIGSATTFTSTTADVTFNNGPSGINNYAGDTYEFVDEFMANGTGLSCHGLAVTPTWSCFGQGVANRVLDAAESPLGDVAAVNNRLGVWALDTGSTNTGLVWFWTSEGSTDYGNGNWTFEGTFRFPFLSTAGEEFSFVAGWQDLPGTPDTTDGCYFLYDRGATQATPGTGDSDVTGDRWKIVCGNNATRTGYDLDGTATEDSFTSVNSPVVAGTWYRLRIVMEGASKARFYIDGTEVGRITTNIPTGSARSTMASVHMLKSAGTTSRYAYVDQTRLLFQQTTQRSP